MMIAPLSRPSVGSQKARKKLQPRSMRALLQRNRITFSNFEHLPSGAFKGVKIEARHFSFLKKEAAEEAITEMGLSSLDTIFWF